MLYLYSSSERNRTQLPVQILWSGVTGWTTDSSDSMCPCQEIRTWDMRRHFPKEEGSFSVYYKPLLSWLNIEIWRKIDQEVTWVTPRVTRGVNWFNWITELAWSSSPIMLPKWITKEVTWVPPRVTREVTWINQITELALSSSPIKSPSWVTREVNWVTHKITRIDWRGAHPQ